MGLAGCLSKFDTFRIISATEAKRGTGAANKQCALDPVPTWLVKRFVDDLSPFIAHLINATFLSEYFPASQTFAQSINQSAFIYLLAPLRGSVAITNNDIVLLKAKTNSTKNPYTASEEGIIRSMRFQ